VAAWAANRYPRESSVTPDTDRSSDRARHVTISARDDGVPSRADNASERKRGRDHFDEIFYGDSIEYFLSGDLQFNRCINDRAASNIEPTHRSELYKRKFGEILYKSKEITLNDHLFW